MKAVLQPLREYKLYVKPSKCDFFKIQVQNLGHVISKEGAVVEPEKMKAVMEWPTLRNVMEVKSFVGWQDIIGDSSVTFRKLDIQLQLCKGKG